jgi:hypothetical protein
LAVFLFAALASTLQPVSDTRARAQSTVRIVRPVHVAVKEWEQLPSSRRREIVVVEEGRRIAVRLIEME